MLLFTTYHPLEIVVVVEVISVADEIVLVSKDLVAVLYARYSISCA